MCSKRVTENAQSPYAPKEPEPEEQLDPEKFKKVMKIHESDETQKRHKRNLKKEDEEGEDEHQVQEQPLPSASSSFSEFMSDKEELDNVLDSESGGIRRQAAPQQGSAFTAPPPGSISTEGVDLGEEPPPPPSPGPAEIPAQPPAQAEEAQAQPPPPPSTQPETSEEQTPSEQPPPTGAPFYEGLPQEQPPYAGQPQQQPPPTSEEAQGTQAPVEQPPEGQKSDQHAPGKKEESDTSLLASQPKASDLKVKKTTKKKPAPEVKTIPSEPKIEGPVSKTGETKGTELQEGLVEKGEQKPLGLPQGKEEGLESAGTSPIGIKAHAPTAGETEEPLGKTAPFKGQVQEEGNFRKLSPNEVRIQRMTNAQAKAEGQAAIEGVPISAPEEGAAMGKKGSKKEEGGFLEASQLTASITLPVSEMALTPITPSDVTPSYSKLSPEIYELFEKMGGVMLIQQHAGITTTTMTVNMPESVFNGSQIILDRYSTAPNAFNIQLVGTPEAVKAFRANITQLENAFKQANYDFEANILNPVLTTSKKSPHLIRRKGAAGGKGGKGDKRK